MCAATRIATASTAAVTRTAVGDVFIIIIDVFVFAVA